MTAGAAEVKTLVVVDELGRVVGVVVRVIEGVRLDVERLRMLLQLLQLLDDRRPHLLRHCGLNCLTDLAQLKPQLSDIAAGVPGIDQRLQPGGGDRAAGTSHVLAQGAVIIDTDSQGIGVQWSENANADDFSKNLIRARCEGRFGTSVLPPLGVVVADLTA